MSTVLPRSRSFAPSVDWSLLVSERVGPWGFCLLSPQGPFLLHRKILLYRYASAGAVVGGASRLFSAFLKEHSEEVISYSDPRYASGKLYEILGFSRKCEYEPDYFYIRGDEVRPKSALQKSRLKGKVPDDMWQTQTEAEMAAYLGYSRIYDCGKVTWLYGLSE